MANFSLPQNQRREAMKSVLGNISPVAIPWSHSVKNHQEQKGFLPLCLSFSLPMLQLKGVESLGKQGFIWPECYSFT